MKIIFIAVIFLIGSAVTDPVDYRLLKINLRATLDDYNPVKQCPTSRVGCQSCSMVAICDDPNNNGEWVFKDPTPCPTGRACVKGKCVPAEQSDCGNGADMDFLCTTMGMFPNPGDCHRFHCCVVTDPATGKLEEYPQNCGLDYGYNPKTTFCDKKLVNKKCGALPVPLCKQDGETGALKENPTLYYSCKNRTDTNAATTVLYPVLYACDNGQIYNPATATCK